MTQNYVFACPILVLSLVVRYNDDQYMTLSNITQRCSLPLPTHSDKAGNG